MNRLRADVAIVRRSTRGEPFRVEAAFETGDGITVVGGASGAGKSSLLLAILGALRPTRGRVSLGRRVLFDREGGVDLPIRTRRIGMVFQDALLFPHLDCTQNAGFGLQGPDQRRRALELLAQVGAGDLATRHPDELSGGQRQRVALARALGAQPEAMLLDEPFSALDAAARSELGELILELQRTTGIPFIHVTHDLAEALRLGEKLVLMERGAVIRTGPPSDVIARPGSVIAARAVGTENLLRGIVQRHLPDEGCTQVEVDGTTVWTALLDRPSGTAIELGLRAEDVLLSLSEVRGTSARNVLHGTVEELAERGPVVEVRVTTPASFRVVVTPASVRELALAPNKPVWLLIKAAAFQLLGASGPGGGGQRYNRDSNHGEDDERT